MKTYPFAVITPFLGARSQTFIHRHMSDLIPGKTVAIVREKEAHINDHEIRFPYHVLKESKRDWRWFYQSGLYFIGAKKIGPLQIKGAEYLKRYNVNTVLVEFLDFSLKWLDIAKNLGIRFFAHAHGYDISKTLRKPAMRRRYIQLEKADGLITMSEYSRKRLIEIGLNKKKIHVIPYGIHVPDAPLIRTRHENIHFLSVGRMVAKKGPLLTLAAFSKALDINPRLKLDYVGDGELFDHAKEFVRVHGLSENITLHGSQPNQIILQMLKKADVFLQHSRTDPRTGDEEGLPVAILEAMGNSLPVISTRHAGIPEAVTEGVTGYLVDECDIEGMASHIEQLSHDSKLRNRFGQAGWLRAKQNFSWEKEKTALLKVLDL